MNDENNSLFDRFKKYKEQQKQIKQDQLKAAPMKEAFYSHLKKGPNGGQFAQSDLNFAKGEWGAGGKEKFMEMNASTHFYRARKFAFGSGANTESLMNGLGVLTKKQIAQNAESKFFAPSKYLVPAFALLGLSESESGGDFIANWLLPDMAAMAGWRTGKAVSAGLGKAAGLSGARLMGATALGGLAAGAMGYVGTMAIAETVRQASSSNNVVRRLASDIRSPDLEHDIVQNSSTLTHRQQALQKLSKSALNNRSVVLGNEASILAGMI